MECKTCKHYIDQEWEGTEWKQCEKQPLDWKYENCPFSKRGKELKQLYEARESCLETLQAICKKIEELEEYETPPKK